MNGLAIMMTATLCVGVDYGWQPTEDGQLEYVIQIEPSLLQTLANGEEIFSMIHPDAKGVQHFRIRVGTAELPRQLPFAKENNPPPAGGDFITPPQDPPPLLEEGPKKTSWPDFKLPKDTQLPDNKPDTVDNATINKEPLRRFPPDKPAVNSQADYEEGGAKPKPTAPLEKPAAATTTNAPAKPWLPLVLTTLLLFASVGLNIYLVWIARGFYQRWQTLNEEYSAASVGNV